MARDPDLRRIRVRDHRGGVGPRHREPAGPGPAEEDPDPQPDLPLRAQPLDRRRSRAAVRQRVGRAHGRHAHPRRGSEPGGPAGGGRLHRLLHPRLLRARQRAVRLGDRRRVRGAARRERPAPRPRDHAVLHGRAVHPQLVGDPRRAIPLHHRRAHRTARRGVGHHEPDGAAEGDAVHRQPGRHRPQRDDRRRPAARLALHGGRLPPRRDATPSSRASSAPTTRSRAPREGSAAPGARTSSRPRTSSS